MVNNQSGMANSGKWQHILSDPERSGTAAKEAASVNNSLLLLETAEELEDENSTEPDW